MTIASLKSLAATQEKDYLPPVYPSIDEEPTTIADVGAFIDSTINEAATTIQRAFRYSRPALRAEVRKRVPLSDNQALQLTLQKRGLASFPMYYIPRPLPGIYSVDIEKAKKWVDAHPPEIRPLAQKFISCITYKSHKQFEKQLQLTCQDFNRRLYSLPENKRNYLIVLNHGTDGFNSSAWVQLLALKYLDTKYLVGIHDLKALGITAHLGSQLALKDLQAAHNFLICDDGAFSGNQNNGILARLLLSADKQVFVAIPFMTRQSIKRIAGIKNELNAVLSRLKTILPFYEYKPFYMNKKVPVSICVHQIIFTCQELGIKYANLSTLSPFVFNHKIACDVSVPEQIFTQGSTLPFYAYNRINIIDKTILRNKYLEHKIIQLSKNRFPFIQDADFFNFNLHSMTDNDNRSREVVLDPDAVILSKRNKTVPAVPFMKNVDMLPIYKQPHTKIHSSL